MKSFIDLSQQHHKTILNNFSLRVESINDTLEIQIEERPIKIRFNSNYILNQITFEDRGFEEEGSKESLMEELLEGFDLKDLF